MVQIEEQVDQHGDLLEPERIDQFLLEVRTDLAKTYPWFSRRRMRRILRRNGLSRFPDALLLHDGARGPGEVFRRVRRIRESLRGGSATHPLFWGGFYRAAYPDVGASRVDPWLHYQVFGRSEGRSPHPLIDIKLLSSYVDDRLPGNVLDAYLTRSEYWLASPGPYVDAQRFALAGPWNGLDNPLLQIVRSYPVDPWIRARLGTIDLADASDPLRIAAGVLSNRNPELARLSGLTEWTRTSAPFDKHAAKTYRVVPGYFLGADGTVIESNGRSVQSRDGTAVRSGDSVITLDVRDDVRGEHLTYLVGDGLWQLESLVAELRSADVVAPATSAQEAVLRQSRARVLALGRQVTVQVASMDVRKMTEGRS